MPFWSITKPTAGTGVSKANFGDLVVDCLNWLYGLRDMPIWIPVNGATSLTAGDKAYYRIPAKYNGGTIVGVSAACKGASTLGTVEFAVKNGSTSVMTTNPTLDQGETDTLTAATPPVINTAADDIATGNMIEISVVQAGTGVTYAGVEIILRAPA